MMSSTTTINNFGFLCTVVIFWIITFINDAHGDFSCSQCDSRKDNYYGECERYPPDPTPCPKNSESMFCSIVREIDFEGIQLLFSRGCATKYLDERCIVQNMTNGSMVRQKNVCFRTCATSGCNSESLSPRGTATQLKPHFSKIALFVFLTVYISSCYQFVTDQIN